MKKFRNLLLILAVLVLLPLNVFADEKINVYIFRGEGCGYCAKALTFFSELSSDEEYKNYFNLVENEVWNDKDNATKMQSVADYFGEKVNGVPYIIIADKTFQGFTEDYEEDIKSAIKTAYENNQDGKYQDIVASILDGTAVAKEDKNSAVAIVIIIAVIAGICFLIYMARDDESVALEKEVHEVKKEEVIEKTTKPKKSSTTKKKTPTKTTGKKTTTKKNTSKKNSSKK